MSPIRVTCALIEWERKVLVAQRPPGKALAGKWEFPGGKIDKGESPNACLKREICEELGCEVDIKSPLTPVTCDYAKGSIELIPFRCVIKAGQPRALEHSAIEWVDPLKLRELDLAEADQPIVEEYLEQLGSTHGIAS